jgi:hypothetical protein
MRTSSSRAAAHRFKVNKPSIDFDEDCSGEVPPRSGTHPEETTPDHTSCSTDELILQMLHLSRNVTPLRNPLNIPRPRLIVLIHLKSVSMRSDPKSNSTGIPTSFSKKKLVFRIKLALLKATEHDGSLAVSLNRVTMSTVDDRDPRLDLLARRLRRVSLAVESSWIHDINIVVVIVIESLTEGMETQWEVESCSSISIPRYQL